MDKKPLILITNDDGIEAPGIFHLWRALHGKYRLAIVAPHGEQSAVGLGLNIRSKLHLTQVEWHAETMAWSLTGTPADCVKMALNMLDETPALIVSGINQGSNAGRNVLYSGTVGGVIEGTLCGIPGIAFSCRDYLAPNYHTAEKLVPAVVSHVFQHPLPSGTLLNVNFPDGPHAFPKGFKLTRQGLDYWLPHAHEHAKGEYSYTVLKQQQFDEHPESDISWLDQGYVTAVPIHVNEMTDHAHLERSKNHFEAMWAGE